MAGSAGNLSVTARLHTALAKPIPQRCQDITKMMEDTSIKELHSVLPLLLENMFGFNNQMGWGVGRLTKNHHYDFVSLRNFLAPTGPLLTLIHKLLLDPYCRYEFPMSCLPYPSRSTLEGGGMCAFYVTKVQFHPGHGQPSNMLSLNSFELFFFHFAYMLVNPTCQKMSTWNQPSDSLYPILLEDYFNYFLPLEGRKVPPINHIAPQVRSPVAHASPIHRTGTGAASPMGSPGRGHFSGLLRTSINQRAAVSPHQMAGQTPDPVEQETWRSQSLIEILVEFWLNQNTLDTNKSAFSQRISPHGVALGHGLDPYHYIMVESFLPSSDHVRVVRMFIKHMHFFTQAARVEMLASPYSMPASAATAVAPMDELRRQVWPQFLQKKLYAFLRHGFDRWPLDSSFRLMLETWLSFIQPWRYTDPSKQHHREREPEKDRTVDDKWFSFVADNLLFYTVLFQEFLPRVFRMDLSAPKNAYMLFRVTKVFNLPNLNNLIRDAESSLYEPMPRLPLTRGAAAASSSFMDLGGSYLSPTHTTRVSSLNLQLTELEAPGFVYKPFFSEYTTKQIDQLVMVVSQAKHNVVSSQSRTDQESSSWFSWLGLGNSVDYNTHTYNSYDYYDDINQGSDMKRLEAHLDQSIANICTIFDLPVPENIGMPAVIPSSPGSPECLAPDHEDTEDGPVLTPLGRYQMMNGLRKFDIQLRGDPEIQRIRSYECAFLVRLLYQVSSFLNDKYAQELESLYYREDLLGRLAALYLTAPQPSRTPPRPRGTSVPSPMSREARLLASRPRVSLRWLASYQNLTYLAVVYLAAYFWLGLGSIGGLVLLTAAGLLYGLLRAAVTYPPKTKRD